jgi:hypothetical protein
MNGSKKDPDSLHHFLGISYESFNSVMCSIGMKKGSATSPSMIEKFVKDIGGKPFAESTPYRKSLMIVLDHCGPLSKEATTEAATPPPASTKAVTPPQSLAQLFYETLLTAIGNIETWRPLDNQPRAVADICVSFSVLSLEAAFY